jgi:hypothetical protein
MGIFLSLEESPVVRGFEVAEFREWKNGYYYRIAVNLADGSSLHAREFFNPEERHYSFHWQTAAGEMILRWDDAPHHRDLATFPYHLHEGAAIRTSLPVSLREVLAEIEKRIGTNG